ncbi:MAG: hypothetical protein HYW22_01730 [Candidatus Aenigmarchaeota archaeon]|nr:hypothetical protein [Candidatus Aenigmarchaeota archaeon]
MPNVDHLLFRREHFPVHVFTGIYSTEVSHPMMPPYHPDMAEIDVELALMVMDQALQDTRLDFEGVTHELPYASDLLDRTPDHIIVDRPEGRIPTIERFSLLPNGLEITRNGLDCLYSSGSCDIYRDRIHEFQLPPDFSEALQREYRIRKVHEYEENGRKIVLVQWTNSWSTHNVVPIEAVFFKNFAVAYNNAFVRRKYSVAGVEYKPDEEGFVRFGEVAHRELEMQTQYAVQYTGIPEFRSVRDPNGPNLGKGLRFKTDKAVGGNYHGVEIHRDDIAEFVRKVKQYQKENHIRDWD